MKGAISVFLTLIILVLMPGCKKVSCEWPYRSDNDPNRCVQVRYDITGIYRGFNFGSDGLTKPRDEYAIWAYHDDPKTITIVPGTIEGILTGENSFYITKQLWDGHPKLLEIKEGTGFVKDTFMEMKLIVTVVGDTVSPPGLFTFRGVKPKSE